MAEKHKGTTVSGHDVCHCYQGGGFHPRVSCGTDCECCDPGGNRAQEDIIRRPVTNGEEELYRRDMLGADGVTTTIIDDGYRVDPSKKKFEPYIIGGLVAVGVLFLFGMIKIGSKENK